MQCASTRSCTTRRKDPRDWHRLIARVPADATTLPPSRSLPGAEHGCSPKWELRAGLDSASIRVRTRCSIKTTITGVTVPLWLLSAINGVAAIVLMLVI